MVLRDFVTVLLVLGAVSARAAPGEINAAFDAGMIHVESFQLNSSQLTPAGSVYTPELIVSPP